MKLTEPAKRDDYLRLGEIGGLVFDHYPRVILCDHIERTWTLCMRQELLQGVHNPSTIKTNCVAA